VTEMNKKTMTQWLCVDQNSKLYHRLYL